MPLTRRALLASTLGSLARLPAQAQSRPHVVVLLADDLGWADVSFHGSEIRTPNLQRLADSGARLEQFYSYPVCSPTRSALMTGRSPMRLGLGNTVIRPWSEFGLPVHEKTMAQHFQEAGYETAMAGKWHLGHAYRKFLPGSRGFDHSYGHFNGAIDYFTHLREGGLDWHRNGKALEEPGYSTDLIGAEAVRRIRTRDERKPLLLYVPFNAPHSPLQAPEAAIARYNSIQDRQRRIFAAMTETMDAAVGRILDALEERQMTRNTIVLFFSDNGGPVNLGARNTPLRGAKATVFEGGIRVPAVIRWPGRIQAGVQFQQPAAAWDLLPTLAGAAGVPLKGGQPLDGEDLHRIFKGEASPRKRDELFFSVETGQGRQLALRHGDWKLVETGSGRARMLFNLGQDPNETKDLAAEQPKLVEDLAARMRRWVKTAPPETEIFTNNPPAGFQPPQRWADAAKP